MKITQADLKKLINEEIEKMLESDEVDEGILDALRGATKKVAGDVGGVAKKAATAVGQKASAAAGAVKQYGSDVAKAGRLSSAKADLEKVSNEIEMLKSKLLAARERRQGLMATLQNLSR